MFIAINQTNEDLIRFAMDSRKMGAEKGFYREFTSEYIQSILNDSTSLNLEEKNDFYTDKSSKDLPQEIYDLLEESLILADKFSDQIYDGNKYASPREHLENLEKIHWQYIQQIDRPLEQWLIKLRQLTRHPVFQNKKLLEKVAHDIITNFELLTEVKFDSLSDFEQEHLRHFLRHAAGLEDNT